MRNVEKCTVRSKQLRLIGLSLVILFLVGCATPTPTLYQWGSYQDQVYAMYHGESKSASPEAQLAKLEEDYQKARSTNKAVPPGYHAHMGLLYFQKGDAQTALAQFQTERALFPESAVYMDRLIAKLRDPATIPLVVKPTSPPSPTTPIKAN